MNKYLEKIASEKMLPYRDRVEVIIHKDGKILVTKNVDKKTGETYYGFPGGGTDGKSETKTGKEESLEEVGVRVKNLVNTNVIHKQEGGMSKKDDRHLKFRGSITKWYKADFDKVDKSVFGRDGDGRDYTFKSPQEALQALSRGKYMVSPRLDALNASKAL
jgi:8-oxo-dGTP pyrophosphatase MutT (NUDIX family)